MGGVNQYVLSLQIDCVIWRNLSATTAMGVKGFNPHDSCFMPVCVGAVFTIQNAK